MDTAATSNVSSETLYALVRTLQQFIGFYEWIITIRVILYWFPNFNPYSFPFSIFTYASYPFLRLFDRLLPVIFGMDLSLYLGFIFLEGIKRFLAKLMLIL